MRKMNMDKSIEQKMSKSMNDIKFKISKQNKFEFNKITQLFCITTLLNDTDYQVHKMI